MNIVNLVFNIILSYISPVILRDKTMADKLMINKITPSLNNKYWLKRLDTQLNKPTNQDYI